MNDNYQSLYYCKKDRRSERVRRLVITTTDSLTSQARAFIGVNVCTLRVSELNCVTKKEKKMKREQLNYIYLMSMHFPRRGPWLQAVGILYVRDGQSYSHMLYPQSPLVNNEVIHQWHSLFDYHCYLYYQSCSRL